MAVIVEILPGSFFSRLDRYYLHPVHGNLSPLPRHRRHDGRIRHGSFRRHQPRQTFYLAFQFETHLGPYKFGGERLVERSRFPPRIHYDGIP